MTRRVAAGAVVIASAAALAALAGAWLGGDSAYVVRAEFRDLGGVRKNSDVKVGGIPVGRVSAVALTERDTAIATLELDRDAGTVGAGASARSRPAGVFGDKYVDLRPGDTRHPLPSGSTLPLSRTSVAVELDDVLDTLAPDVRTRLQILIQEAGIALTGRGEQFAQLLRALPPSLREARRLLGELDHDNGVLADVVTRGDRVLAGLGRRRGDLADLVSTGAQALAAVAERRGDVQATVAHAPPALRRLRGTLTRLERTADGLGRASGVLRATAPALTDLLRRLPSFATRALPAFAALDASVPALTDLSRRGSRRLRQLLPALVDLAAFARSSRPAVAGVDASRFDLVATLEGWARAIQNRDGLGHYVQGQVIVSRALVQGLLDSYLRPSRRKARRAPAPSARPRVPRTPAPALKQPSLPRLELPTPPRLQEVLPATGGALERPLDQLLDYLLR